MIKLSKEYSQDILLKYPSLLDEFFKYDVLVDNKPLYNKHVIAFKEIIKMLETELCISTNMYKNYPVIMLKSLYQIFNNYNLILINYNTNEDLELFEFENMDEFKNKVENIIWDIDLNKIFIIIEEANTLMWVGYEVTVALFFVNYDDTIKKIENIFESNGAIILRDK